MKRLILFLFLVYSGILLNGQSIDELRIKKEKTLEQIKYTNRLLNETQKDEKSSMNKLNLLNEQIKLRNQLITGYNSEIKLIDGMIAENTRQIKNLDADLVSLKKEYAEMIRFAQKNRNSYDKTLFLLSAKNFNQAYKRLAYLQQYSKYRQKQAAQISDTRNQIDQKVKELENQKKQKQQVLADKQMEARKLDNERAKQGQYVTSLRQKQKDLQKQLREQQKIDEQLSREIERIVEEEARKSQKKGTTGFSLTPEQKLISGQLEQNRGRLPWPVERGIITERFGIHAHPVLKTVQVKNNGIDIATSSGARARSVFDGEISRVFGISGGNMAVIVRHGNYLTVYSNLKTVSVKAGDKIKAKQDLGVIFTDENDGNKTILKFQIWKESQKLDPELWLSK